MLAILDSFVPAGLDASQRQRAQFTTAVLLLQLVVLSITGLVSSLVLFSWFGTLGYGSCIVACLAGLLLVRVGRVGLASGLFLLIGWTVTNVVAGLTGGISSPAYQVNIAALVLAALIGRTWQVMVMYLATVGIGLLFITNPAVTEELQVLSMTPSDNLLVMLFSFTVVSVLVTSVTYLYERSAKEALQRQGALLETGRRLQATTVSTDYMRDVLSAVRDMILVTDRHGTITDLNPAVSDQLGLNRSELVGKPITMLGALEGLVDQPSVLAFSTLLHRADGRQLPVLLSRGELESRSADGVTQMDGFVWAISDTTVQEAAVEAVRRAHTQAEAANVAKSRFLANMSHELRTPLNAIIGYSELLSEEIEQPGQLADLERVREAAQHLLQLINGVLDLSKVEAGKERLEITQVDVDQIVTEVHLTIAPMVGKAGIQFTRTGSIAGAVRMDAGKLRQILLNLTANAVKFTAAGKVRLHAERWDREGMPWLRFVVEDTGIGMSADQLQRIFEPFAQADATTERKYGGTGLGLSISQAFVRMMGGEIYVTSLLGQGTTFTVELPVGELRQLRTPGLASRFDMPERHGGVVILCIDDDRSVLELLTRLLTTETRQVVGTSDPEQGLVWARALNPDLITVDIQMPGMSGWNVLAHLKQDPTLSHIPTLVISADGEEPVARALGAHGVIRKPLDRAALERAVTEALTRPRRTSYGVSLGEDA